MKKIRFSIASLLTLVLIVAVGLAALHASSDAWDGGVFSLILLTLLTSILVAVHSNGRKRAFWIGFALFGLAYLMASLVPTIESRLPSSRCFAYLDSKLSDRVKSINWAWPLVTAGGGRASQGIAFLPNEITVSTSDVGNVEFWNAVGVPSTGSKSSMENFVRIGHSLLALLMALVGGQLSRFLFDRRSRLRTEQNETSSEPAPTSPEDDVENGMDSAARG